MITIAEIRKSVVIAAPQAHVFTVFTEGVDKWWPREHHIGTSPLKRAIIETKAGGRWYSTCQDGSEIDIGKVLVWEPPKRLVLSWQITSEWKFDPNFVTEVDITFTAEAPNRTRVDLEHRDIARFGVAAETMGAMFDSPGGWTATLESFAKAAMQ